MTSIISAQVACTLFWIYNCVRTKQETFNLAGAVSSPLQILCHRKRGENLTQVAAISFHDFYLSTYSFDSIFSQSEHPVIPSMLLQSIIVTSYLTMIYAGLTLLSGSCSHLEAQSVTN